MDRQSISARLFVTGLGGFVGSHLAARIALDPAVYELAKAIDFELRDPASLERALSSARPDLVVHLAAQSSVAESLRDPRTTYEINYLGTLNLLEALSATGFHGRMLYVGSGDEYGFVADTELPVPETHPLRPRNPYAVSKVAAEALCYQWSQTGAFEIVLARPFNSIGPGQGTRFAIADFARQIVEAARGRRPPRLETGDLDVTRDFTDVRDVVAAYLVLLERGVNGEAYNVCSGREQVLRDLVEQMAALAGVALELVTVPARMRPGEQRRMVGDAAKLFKQTGWFASTPVATTLRDIIDDWSGRIGE
ncbi:MAG TPA: GDP-mannose 4,6-dehydratase [Casimicrobiaceae bacterium]|jgi:GDP-4-dehydro-6-deoxy-D-mannose reductase